MGIFKDLVTSQLIDVIEWTDDSQNTMVYKYDMNGKEIMMGAQLTVRESQAAIFVNEGKLADVFQPGRYELSTQNMPILTKLKAWKFGFNSPFKSDVYFINTKQFLDRKWGTANPVMMRDTDFGMIRIRAFGSFAFRVKEPETFMKECFGTSSLFTVEGVEGQLKSMVVSGLSDAIAQSKIPALDIAANYSGLSQYCMNALNTKVEALGLTLTNFVIENVSLPEEVEKAMDKRTSMGVLGDMGKYAQFQAAEAMRDAANNPNGMAGVGVGMGAGMGMGQMFTQAFGGAQQQVPAAPAAPAAATVACTACGKKRPLAASAPTAAARSKQAASSVPTAATRWRNAMKIRIDRACRGRFFDEGKSRWKILISKPTGTRCSGRTHRPWKPFWPRTPSSTGTAPMKALPPRNLSGQTANIPASGRAKFSGWSRSREESRRSSMFIRRIVRCLSMQWPLFV